MDDFDEYEDYSKSYLLALNSLQKKTDEDKDKIKDEKKDEKIPGNEAIISLDSPICLSNDLNNDSISCHSISLNDSNLSAPDTNNILNPDSPVIIDSESEGEELPLKQRLRGRKTKRKKPPLKPKKKLKKIDKPKVINDDLDLTPILTDVPDDNPEISVKVYWRCKDLHKIVVRKFQKIDLIYKFFAQLEGLPDSRILLTLDERILKPTDTPDSLNLKITDILEGGIQKEENTPSIVKEKNPVHLGNDSITLKVLSKESKEPFLISIKKSEKMKFLIIKVAELIEKPIHNIRIDFDGDVLDPNETPSSLELDGGECFELKIL